jgi:hypothetical protein
MAADDYMTVARKFARDSRLTLKARGLGLWLFSHTDGWNLSVRTIAKQVGAGVEAVQSGLKELEVHGYLRRERQHGEAGQFADMDYVVTDVPDHVPAGESTSGKPVHGGQPDTGEPSTGKPTDRVSDTHKETTPKETISEGDQPEGDISATGALFDILEPEKPRTSEPSAIPEVLDFPAFWDAYPLKKAKQTAYKAWQKALFQVSLDGRTNRAELILEGAKRYAKERENEPAQFTKHPATWLNGHCWEDDPAPAKSSNPRGGYQQYRDEDLYPDAKPWFDPADLQE